MGYIHDTHAIQKDYSCLNTFSEQGMHFLGSLFSNLKMCLVFSPKGQYRLYGLMNENFEKVLSYNPYAADG